MSGVLGETAMVGSYSAETQTPLIWLPTGPWPSGRSRAWDGIVLKAGQAGWAGLSWWRWGAAAGCSGWTVDRNRNSVYIAMI